jgi:hypothetical protein
MDCAAVALQSDQLAQRESPSGRKAPSLPAAATAPPDCGGARAALGHSWGLERSASAALAAAAEVPSRAAALARQSRRRHSVASLEAQIGRRLDSPSMAHPALWRARILSGRSALGSFPQPNRFRRRASEEPPPACSAELARAPHSLCRPCLARLAQSAKRARRLRSVQVRRSALAQPPRHHQSSCASSEQPSSPSLAAPRHRHARWSQSQSTMLRRQTTP